MRAVFSGFLLLSIGAGCNAGAKTPDHEEKMDGSQVQAAADAGDVASSHAGASSSTGGTRSTAAAGAAAPAVDAGMAGAPSGEAGKRHETDSGSAGTAGTTAPRVIKPLAQLPDAFAEGICSAIEACVGAQALRELTEREDCATRVAAQLRATEFAAMSRALDRGHVLYEPSNLPACMDAIQALGCDVLSHSLPKPCAEVLIGNMQIGGECVISAECTGAAFCDGTDQCPSHCVPWRTDGESCSGDNQCGDDLMCIDGSCSRPSRAGEPCKGTSGKVCRLGFTCQGSTDVETGHCVDNAMVRVGGAGDVCEPGGQLCKEGFSCVYDGKSGFHCETAVGIGEKCHLGLPGQCPREQYCDTSQVTQAGTCRTLPGDGQACVLTGLCAPGFVCVAESNAHVCRAIAANCSVCASDATCRSGQCQDGRCVPPTVCEQIDACP